jgi:MscS family membrane protein
MRNGQRAWAVWSLALLLAVAVAVPAWGQDGKPAAGERPALPPGPDRPLAEKLATPRDTLKTLCFAAVAYDFYPKLIGDAIACLEPEPKAAGNKAEAAQRAIELETVLRELNLPLTAAPEHPDEGLVVLHDADGFRVALRRQADGLWRFDRETVERVPAMWRAALARHRNLQAERAALREGCTDPAATMRRFLLDAVFRGDYYAAARCLDLSALTSDQRRDRGPVLAQQLAYVIQRRGWIFYQEIPDQPAGPPYTWHADEAGRILLERVPQPDGKDAWLFSKRTVSNLPRMVEQAKEAEPDHRYARLGKVIQTPELERGQDTAAQRPERP